MNKCLSNLDSRADKQRFLEANHTAFMIPKKFDAATYQKKIDEVCLGLDLATPLLHFPFFSWLFLVTFLCGAELRRDAGAAASRNTMNVVTKDLYLPTR